jgi:hypothetical protein
VSQNIALWGNNYSSVPGIVLPKQGGGTALFTDVTPTTAGDSDVAAGKIYFKSDGTQSTGTASGGGGASNIVTGTFTTPATTGAASSFTIPYTGTGYPMQLRIWVDGGTYNNSSTGGNTTWYNATQRYAIGEFSLTKARMNSAPSWGTSGASNYGVVMLIYKSAVSTSTTYSRTSTMTANSFSTSDADSTSTTTVRFKGNGTTVSYWVGYYTSSSSYQYGLMANTKYAYLAVYSS